MKKMDWWRVRSAPPPDPRNLVRMQGTYDQKLQYHWLHKKGHRPSGLFQIRHWNRYDLDLESTNLSQPL